jgi:hypothetical protein
MIFKKKKKSSPEEELQQRKEKTANNWIPIADIDNSIVRRKDNYLVGIIKVEPTNLELLSNKEKQRKINSLSAELNGLKKGFQIFCIGRPVDLNSYLEWLQEKARMEEDFIRKQVLKGYIKQASMTASSGEITERRFYIMLKSKNEDKAKEELFKEMEELVSKLDRAELKSKICNDSEIMDLYSIFSSPIQSAYEQEDFDKYNIPTVLQ